VALNVSDTQLHLDLFTELALTKNQARERLGLLNYFTMIYVGAIDKDKRLKELLFSLSIFKKSNFNLIIAGDGPEKDSLQRAIAELGLSNVHLVGKLPWSELATYYRASDVFVLPGRGGMVISESMAHGLPVIVYQADGTEYDLIRGRSTGVCLLTDDPEELNSTILWLQNNPDITRNMGKAAQNLVSVDFSQANSASAIYDALCKAALLRAHREPA
jgi:glycosyltransferase involved in cell wall biosynthesis